MTGRAWIALGAVLGGLAVAAGAMGTHYLEEVLHWDEKALATHETAARYQIYHALALILAGILALYQRSAWITAAAWAFIGGAILFSGGIYAYQATDIKPFVHVVPIGGTAWIVGWLCLAIGGWQLRGERTH